MLWPEHLLKEREAALQKRKQVGIFALGSIELDQGVYIGKDCRMGRLKVLFGERQLTLEQGFGLGIPLLLE
jgi:hypothetical protein